MRRCIEEGISDLGDSFETKMFFKSTFKVVDNSILNKINIEDQIDYCLHVLGLSDKVLNK